jgi:hypothetical protein
MSEVVPREFVLNANGTRLYAMVLQGEEGGSFATIRVVEFDVATGRQRRTLLQVSHGYSLTIPWRMSSLALDPSGRLLLVGDAGADFYRIDLGAARATRLPTTVHRGNPLGLAW